MAHRVAYALWVGEIPEGMTVNHKSPGMNCTGPVPPNTLDMNPEHLELMTHQANVLERNLRAPTPRCKECGQFLETHELSVCVLCYQRANPDGIPI